MGGATLPTANTPGYTTFRGRVTCTCLAKWLPVYERLLLAAGVIKQSVDIVQLTGGVAASGGTHTKGGAFDVKQRTATAIRLGREMGAPAFWARDDASWAGNEHAHGVLLGCPHNSPARYQLDAQRAGYNGLGQAKTGRYAGMWGYGGLDPHPAPDTYRTWEQGIAWAETEIARLTKPTPVAAVEDDMTPEQAKRLDDIYAAVTGLRSEESGRYKVATGRYGWIAGALNGIAAKTGVTLDEQAVADALVAQLAPSLAESLSATVARLAPAVSADEVRKAAADAVRDVLGALDNPAS